MTKKKLGSVKNTDEVVITACDLANDVTGTLPVTNGGTGQTTYTNGQLLIGNTTGNTLTKATLTQGTGITITNGAGSITIASTVSGADYVAKAGDNMTGVLQLNESAQIGASATTDLGTATGNTVTIATTSASYASKSMSVSGQDSAPYGLAFSSDGTKCYVMGDSNNTVYQYTLSTAWDISTGSYASKSMSVSSQDTSPYGLAFSSDGTKCYVMGDSNNTVYQYTLSTAWDISTGSYASKSMSVSGQDSAPYGLAFSSDGTKCYVLGAFNDTVYQYTLSTAWDISTGSYASKSMSVSGQDSAPYGLAFSSDGTKCYVIGISNDTVYQYTLSTAWDISTGSYASKSMSVASQESVPRALALSSDGTKCYVIGTVNNTVYQYTLDFAWELTNVSTAITSLGGASLQAGTEIETIFSISVGTLTLTHHATNLYLAGGENITLENGDVIRWRKMHSSNAEWKMVGGLRASGAAWAYSGFTVRTPVTMATSSPTEIGFTSIPAGVSMVIVGFRGASTNGTSGQIIQLGHSGGYVVTGYTGTVETGTGRAAHNTGFLLAVSTTAAMAHHGHLILARMDSAGTEWSLSGNLSLDTGANGVYSNSGSVTLAGALDRIRWTTVGGTNVADGGTMNILYI